MYKTCSHCKNHKLLDDFHKLKMGQFGRHSECKDCRKIKRKNITSVISNTLCCNLCNKRQPTDKFYINNSSKSGHQSYCIDCQKTIIASSKSKINNFSKIILEKFKKKNKEIKITLSEADIINQFNKQKGLCHITNHNMTHEVDIKQRTDNIWNYSIYIERNNLKEITKSDIHLVVNLIYTIKNLYKLDHNSILKIYKEISP